MTGNKLVAFEDLDLVRHAVDLDQAAAGRIGNRVIVAANAHHALAPDPAIELQDRAERDQRQEQQCRLLLGKRLIHDPAGRCMQAGIGDITQPAFELQIEIVEIAKDTAEEEVLPDVAEGPFDFALRFRTKR